LKILRHALVRGYPGARLWGWGGLHRLAACSVSETWFVSSPKAQRGPRSIKIQETTQNSIMNIWIVAHQIHLTWRFCQRGFGQCYPLFLSCIHPKVKSGQPAARQGAALPPLDLPLGPEDKESSRMFLKICKFCLAVIWGWAPSWTEIIEFIEDLRIPMFIDIYCLFKADCSNSSRMVSRRP
jgi:hypothetical protein